LGRIRDGGDVPPHPPSGRQRVDAVRWDRRCRCGRGVRHANLTREPLPVGKSPCCDGPEGKRLDGTERLTAVLPARDGAPDDVEAFGQLSLSEVHGLAKEASLRWTELYTTLYQEPREALTSGVDDVAFQHNVTTSITDERGRTREDDAVEAEERPDIVVLHVTWSHGAIATVGTADHRRPPRIRIW